MLMTVLGLPRGDQEGEEAFRVAFRTRYAVSLCTYGLRCCVWTVSFICQLGFIYMYTPIHVLLSHCMTRWVIYHIGMVIPVFDTLIRVYFGKSSGIV